MYKIIYTELYIHSYYVALYEQVFRSEPYSKLLKGVSLLLHPIFSGLRKQPMGASFA